MKMYTCYVLSYIYLFGDGNHPPDKELVRSDLSRVTANIEELPFSPNLFTSRIYTLLFIYNVLIHKTQETTHFRKK